MTALGLGLSVGGFALVGGVVGFVALVGLLLFRGHLALLLAWARSLPCLLLGGVPLSLLWVSSFPVPAKLVAFLSLLSARAASRRRSP